MSAAQPKTIHPSASSSTINAAGSTRRVGGEDEDEKKSIDQEKHTVSGEVDNVDPSEAQHGEHPDGGLRAWLAVIGVCSVVCSSVCVRYLLTCAQCATGACATFGFVNAWGVSCPP